MRIEDPVLKWRRAMARRRPALMPIGPTRSLQPGLLLILVREDRILQLSEPPLPHTSLSYSTNTGGRKQDQPTGS